MRPLLCLGRAQTAEGKRHRGFRPPGCLHRDRAEVPGLPCPSTACQHRALLLKPAPGLPHLLIKPHPIKSASYKAGAQHKQTPSCFHCTCQSPASSSTPPSSISSHPATDLCSPTPRGRSQPLCLSRPTTPPPSAAVTSRQALQHERDQTFPKLNAERREQSEFPRLAATDESLGKEPFTNSERCWSGNTSFLGTPAGRSSSPDLFGAGEDVPSLMPTGTRTKPTRTTAPQGARDASLPPG